MCIRDRFNTYWEYWDGNTDAFCGSYSYYMKRRLGYPPIKKGEVMSTIQMYGILSANIEKSIPQFIKHIDSSLKLTYFKAIKSPTQINVSLDIKLNNCKISTIYIKANNEIDKHFINELYRIIYTCLLYTSRFYILLWLQVASLKSIWVKYKLSYKVHL